MPINRPSSSTTPTPVRPLIRKAHTSRTVECMCTSAGGGREGSAGDGDEEGDDDGGTEVTGAIPGRVRVRRLALFASVEAEAAVAVAAVVFLLVFPKPSCCSVALDKQWYRTRCLSMLKMKII